MTQKDKTKDKSAETDPQLDKVSTGAHLGGTHLGGAGGDAKVKDPREGGDKARPNDGTR